MKVDVIDPLTIFIALSKSIPKYEDNSFTLNSVSDIRKTLYPFFIIMFAKSRACFSPPPYVFQ